MNSPRRGLFWPALAFLLGAPALWQVVVWSFAPHPSLLPPPAMVARVLIEERAGLLHHTAITLGEAVLGYALANVVALSCALLFFFVPRLEQLGSPWVVVAKNVPFPAVAGILTVMLGDTLLPKVLVVALVTFFPVLANVTKGLAAADPVLLDRLRSLDASRWQTFWKVCWPAALPSYFAAHEIAFTGSIIGAVVAEWLFARAGLGFVIVQATTQFRADRLFAATLLASLLAVGAYLLVRLIEARLFRWRR